MSGTEPRLDIRPRAGPQLHPASRAFARLVLAGLASSLLLGTALAQPPREDPGSPPDSPGGDNAGWQVLTIPNLPANALLGDVWVAPNGDAYVWANYPTVTRGVWPSFDDLPEGERLPGGEGSSLPRSSTLYRYDGMRWSVMLTKPGETAVALYGSNTSDLWASTNTPSGEVGLYHFNGTSWSTQTVAGYYLGRAMAKTPCTAPRESR